MLPLGGCEVAGDWSPVLKLTGGDLKMLDLTHYKRPESQVWGIISFTLSSAW